MKKFINQKKNNAISTPANKNMKQISFEELWEGSDSSPSMENVELESGNYTNEDSFPITLVRDFDRFINYIENHPVQLTKTKEFISRKHLPDLNNRMSIKKEAATSYTEQEYYPYIHFFYYLSLGGRVLEKVSAKAGKLLLKETDRLQLYKELSNIEKYFFLLETFWVDVNWARILNESYNPLPMSLQELFYLLSQKNPGYLFLLNENSESREAFLSMHLDRWDYFLLYFEWFGLWECEIHQERVDNYYRKNRYFAKSIKLTVFGSKVIPFLLLDRNLHIWNIPLRREDGEINPIPGAKLEDMMFGNIPQEVINAIFEKMEDDLSSEPFFQPFKRLFSEEQLQRTLPRNIRKFIDGIYTFKVSLTNGLWRKVVLTGKHTMDHLHKIILNAYEFDDDHLYSFFMDGRTWSNDCIASPYDDYGHPNAAKVQIGDLGLIPGQRFLFLYDYGDEWIFNVEVEQIQEKDSKPFRPFVKERKGDAPDQYGADEYWFE